MQNITVEKLPPCAECVSEGRNEVKEAAMKVATPMRITLNLCDEHFMNYVESRLGPQTVQQLVVVQKAGSGRNKAA